ncbi:MAG: hypothetical protein STSR0009_26090 [Methanoregula sp.]
MTGLRQDTMDSRYENAILDFLTTEYILRHVVVTILHFQNLQFEATLRKSYHIVSLRLLRART